MEHNFLTDYRLQGNEILDEDDCDFWDRSDPSNNLYELFGRAYERESFAKSDSPKSQDDTNGQRAEIQIGVDDTLIWDRYDPRFEFTIDHNLQTEKIAFSELGLSANSWRKDEAGMERALVLGEETKTEFSNEFGNAVHARWDENGGFERQEIRSPGHASYFSVGQNAAISMTEDAHFGGRVFQLDSSLNAQEISYQDNIAGHVESTLEPQKMDFKVSSSAKKNTRFLVEKQQKLRFTSQDRNRKMEFKFYEGKGSVKFSDKNKQVIKIDLSEHNVLTIQSRNKTKTIKLNHEKHGELTHLSPVIHLRSQRLDQSKTWELISTEKGAGFSLFLQHDEKAWVNIVLELDSNLTVSCDMTRANQIKTSYEDNRTHVTAESLYHISDESQSMFWDTPFGEGGARYVSKQITSQWADFEDRRAYSANLNSEGNRELKWRHADGEIGVKQLFQEGMETIFSRDPLWNQSLWSVTADHRAFAQIEPDGQIWFSDYKKLSNDLCAVSPHFGIAAQCQYGKRIYEIMAILTGAIQVQYLDEAGSKVSLGCKTEESGAFELVSANRDTLYAGIDRNGAWTQVLEGSETGKLHTVIDENGEGQIIWEDYAAEAAHISWDRKGRISIEHGKFEKNGKKFTFPDGTQFHFKTKKDGYRIVQESLFGKLTLSYEQSQGLRASGLWGEQLETNQELFEGGDFSSTMLDKKNTEMPTIHCYRLKGQVTTDISSPDTHWTVVMGLPQALTWSYDSLACHVDAQLHAGLASGSLSFDGQEPLLFPTVPRHV